MLKIELNKKLHTLQLLKILVKYRINLMKIVQKITGIFLSHAFD